MTEREQFLFDALCRVRKLVAERKDDALIIEQVYETATWAVRNVTKEPHCRDPGQILRERGDVA